MFCPKCKAEYREGFYRCADCEIDLVQELSSEPEQYPEPEKYVEYGYIDLVNIETYSDRQEAELARGLLSANGIYAVVQGDEDGSWNTGLGFATGIQLLVKKEDVWEAKKFLSEVNKPDNTPEPEQSKNTNQKIAISMLYLVGLILIGCIIILILSF